MKQEFREPPDLPRLFTALAQHGLRYVLFGSMGFMAYGLQAAGGDLHICIDPDEQNLHRLSRLLLEVRAKPRYVPGWSVKEACERWPPEPLVVETFDHLFTTRYGDLDIVPFPYGPHGKEACFTFASLDARAETFAAFGQQIRVAHLDDVIASKLSARREKDLRLLAFDRAITATLRARRSEWLASDGIITEAKATPRLICTYGLGTNSVFHSEQVGSLNWQFNERALTR